MAHDVDYRKDARRILGEFPQADSGTLLDAL